MDLEEILELIDDVPDEEMPELLREVLFGLALRLWWPTNGALLEASEAELERIAQEVTNNMIVIVETYQQRYGRAKEK